MSASTVTSRSLTRSSRIKVLEVVEATQAGVGRHVIDIVSNISVDNFDVTLAWSPIRADDLFRDGVDVARQRGITTVPVSMARNISPVEDARSFWNLRRLISKERFDVVHGHSSKAGFLGRLAGKLASPSALTVYTPNAIAVSLHPAFWCLEKFAAPFTNTIVAVSRSENIELQGYRLVSARRIHTIDSGIAVPPVICNERSASIRDTLRLPKDAVVVATIGRLVRQKSPQTFMHVAERILRRGIPAYFLWIGDGEDREDLEKQVARSGFSDRIRFLGYRKDAQQLVAGCDIFVLTSLYESFGYVTCEAMAQGKAVVASDVTGTRDVVESEVTGLLVPSGDVAAFDAALMRLIKDPKLRQRLGKAGRERLEARFTAERMVHETECLYASLVSQRHHR